MATVTVDTNDLGLNPTFGEIIKLGDLPEEQRMKFYDAIMYSAKHDTEFFNEVNKVGLDSSSHSITFERQYLPEIDKTSDRYKHGIVEGVTPSPEQLTLSYYTATTKKNGWYFKFTDDMLNHAFHSVKERCLTQLKNTFNSYHDEKIIDAYFNSASIITGDKDLTSLEFLSELRAVLKKQGAVPFEGGFYKLVVPMEASAKMLIAFKDILTHTTEKNAIVKGELGEVMGFRLIESKLQAFSEGGKLRYLAYGKTSEGKYPVTSVAYDGMNSRIIFKNLGELGNDPLNQRGSIGLKVDGHGFFVAYDEVCVHGTIDGSKVATVNKVLTSDSQRNGYVASYTTASNIYPSVTTLQLAKGDTHTLVINNENQEAQENSSFAYESTNAGVATVSTAGVITAVEAGLARITISSKTDPTKVNVVTVFVIPALA